MLFCLFAFVFCFALQEGGLDSKEYVLKCVFDVLGRDLESKTSCEMTYYIVKDQKTKDTLDTKMAFNYFLTPYKLVFIIQIKPTNT